MSDWKLMLWPTEQTSTVANETHLQHQWTKDGVSQGSKPELGPDATLEIYFSYSQKGLTENIVPAGDITASLTPLDGTPQLNLVSPDAVDDGSGCSWQVQLPAVGHKTTYSFRVTVTTTPASGAPKTYTVDPEMVIEPDGPPRPTE